MSNKYNTNLEQFLPLPPKDELSRDGYIRQIADTFSADCQQQMVIGATQSGRSNLLAQFARQYSGRTITYFITSNPLQQRQHAFLYSLCFQLCLLLGKNTPSETIKLAELQSMFPALVTQLSARAKNGPYYFVIDGVEWAFEGPSGERIIDVFPIATRPRSPYLLFSCRADKIKDLPSRARCLQRDVPQFNFHETKAFFDGVGFTNEELKNIQDTCNGIPGYLRIIKEIKLAHPNRSFDITDDLARLIEQQVNLTLQAVESTILDALEILAISPAPLSLHTLAGLTGKDPTMLRDALIGTGLVQLSTITGRLAFNNNLLQQKLKEQADDRAKLIIRRMIEYISDNRQDEEDLLELLYKESQDYIGLQAQLRPDAFVTTIRETGDISRIVRRLRIASQMARDDSDYQGLVKWTLGIAAAKCLIDNDIDQDEIRALLSIGKENEALRKIYAFSELSVKIRMLGQAYTFIKKNGGRVSTDAKAELAALTQNLPIDHLDRDIVQHIALDIFPIVPDVAMALLEQIVGRNQRQSLIDMAVQNVGSGSNLESKEQNNADRPETSKAQYYLPSWFSEKPLDVLLDDLKPKTAKAKEALIRQWCRQNPDAPNQEWVVNLWLNTVEEDPNFIIPLRSLRQISETVVRIPIASRLSLINRLRVPRYTSISAPRQEWIRVRLVLAEALFPVDASSALQDLREIHRDILEQIEDLDERAFCLAYLRLTLQTITPQDSTVLRTVREQFEQVFSNLLAHSAEHFEAIRPTLRTLVKIDPEEALIVASTLNMRQRRIRAYEVVIENTLRLYNSKNADRILKDALDAMASINEIARDHCLINVLDEAMQENRIFEHHNLGVLIAHARTIRQSTVKSDALACLAAIVHSCGSNSEKLATDLCEEAIDEWKKIDDLLSRVGVGYRLVEVIAKFSTHVAEHLYMDIQTLYQQPGAGLTLGGLIGLYSDVIRLTIRSLSVRDFTDDSDLLRRIRNLTMRIPARTVRIELAARLAMSAYRANYGQGVADILRSLVINEIKQCQVSVDRDNILAFCLPIIFEYDSIEAVSLAQTLLVPKRNEAWSSVIFWLLSYQHAQDFGGDASLARFSVDRPRLLSALQALSHITYDYMLYTAIRLIVRAVETSFESDKIDVRQAFDILAQVENQVADRSRLPDKENIRHDGYVILAEAAIHTVKTLIWLKRKSLLQLTQKDIERTWQSISGRARQIPNSADRAFVLALLARDLFSYHSKDSRPVQALLNEAYDQLKHIPNLNDRLDRIETTAESWMILGEKEHAKFVLRFGCDLLKELQGAEYSERLAAIARIAYTIGPDFADEVLSMLGKDHPPPAILPSESAIQIARLIENPMRIADILKQEIIQDEVLQQSSRKFLSDYTMGRGTVPHINTTMDWLLRSQSCSVGTIISVTEYAIESMYRRRQTAQSSNSAGFLLEVTDLLLNLAGSQNLSSTHSGIPIELEDSFSGLSSKFVVFQSGDSENAYRWIAQWLNENTQKYLKICDPYFGVDEIDYLRYVPANCRVMIITTDNRLDISEGVDPLKKEIERYWRSVTSLIMPSIFFLVVPRQLEERFHDRAIITDKAGLDIGQSLNGVGKARGKLTILSEHDARELEASYFSDMLTQASWFMNHGIMPTTFTVGDQL